MATGRHLSLEQLERRRRPEPSFKSRLAMTCHCLCQKPIGDFTVEDHRIMIGQKLGLKHLLPLAIEILQDDPLARGDFFQAIYFEMLFAMERRNSAPSRNLHSKSLRSASARLRRSRKIPIVFSASFAPSLSKNLPIFVIAGMLGK